MVVYTTLAVFVETTSENRAKICRRHRIYPSRLRKHRTWPRQAGEKLDKINDYSNCDRWPHGSFHAGARQPGRRSGCQASAPTDTGLATVARTRWPEIGAVFP